MTFILLSGVLSLWPLAEWYVADPSNRTAILPAAVVPRTQGGTFPPPGPLSVRYILARLAEAGRTPGDVIVGNWLEEEKVSAPRRFARVGRARLWKVTYRVDVVGPDGLYTLYTDKTALILSR